MMVNVHGSVEVWCEYTQNWVGGFEIDEATPEAVRLRRTSDGATLAEIRSEKVRPTTR